jgi:hypothetical protein
VETVGRVAPTLDNPVLKLEPQTKNRKPGKSTAKLGDAPTLTQLNVLAIIDDLSPNNQPILTQWKNLGSLYGASANSARKLIAELEIKGHVVQQEAGRGGHGNGGVIIQITETGTAFLNQPLNRTLLRAKLSETVGRKVSETVGRPPTTATAIFKSKEEEEAWRPVYEYLDHLSPFGLARTNIDQYRKLNVDPNQVLQNMKNLIANIKAGWTPKNDQSFVSLFHNATKKGEGISLATSAYKALNNPNTQPQQDTISQEEKSRLMQLEQKARDMADEDWKTNYENKPSKIRELAPTNLHPTLEEAIPWAKARILHQCRQKLGLDPAT